jgi:hypothetical protein
MSFATSVPAEEELYSQAGLAPFAGAAPGKPPGDPEPPAPAREGFTTGGAQSSSAATPQETESAYISQLSGLLSSIPDTSGTATDDHIKTFIEIVLSFAAVVSSERYIRDVNSQLRVVYDRDAGTVDDYVARTSRSVMVNKRMYMMQKREGDKIRDICRMVLRLTAGLSLAAVASPYASSGPGAFLLISIAAAMIAYIVLFIRSASLRRYDDWTKMYWSEEIEPDDEDDDEEEEDSDDVCGE